MPTKIRPKNALLKTGIAEYLNNKRARESATFCYREYGSYYYLNGLIIMPDELERRYPLDLVPKLPKGGNVDRTKNYLHNAKSY